MPRWEYALFSNPATGDDGVAFSHSQGPNFVQEASAALGKGLKAEKSHTKWLHVNMNHTHMAAVAGVLGDRGWELAGFSTLTGGHSYMMFKRQLDDPGAITAATFQAKEAEIMPPNPAEQIQKWAELRDNGTITAEYFEQKKAEVLSQR